MTCFPFLRPPLVGELVEIIERRKEARKVKTDSGVLLQSLVFHRAGEPIAEFRRSWATGCAGHIFHDFRRSAAEKFNSLWRQSKRCNENNRAPN